jgi:mRNA interferase MazF
VIRQGDIYRVDLGDPVGSAPGYRRPVVVIQNDLFNASRLRTALVCVVTSNLQRAATPGNVLVTASESGLERDSVVLVSQVQTMDRAQLAEYVGALPVRRVREVLDGIGLVTEPRSAEGY